MSQKETTRRPWTLRRKLVVGGIIVLVILALALGLGLGLTLGKDDGDDDEPTYTPLPTPTSRLPWTPKVNETWQITLLHPPSLSADAVSTTPNVSIFDLDLFDTPVSTISKLHQLGKNVICYFSAGSYEGWRPDAKEFAAGDLGDKMDGWDEKWLKTSSENVRRIMKKRIELAREKGCDGIDPDNVDGFQNKNGVGLTANDSINYIQYLSSVCRPLNLTLGLKNAGSIISAVLPLVDFSVNEQCAQYSECSKFQPFIAAGKPVFHIEYPAGSRDLQQNVEATGFSADTKAKFCGTGEQAKSSDGFSTVLKKMNLDGWSEYCDGKVEVTSLNETAGNHMRGG
ncbi:glycoside hydrolase superfamily [Phaeosphaeriaceae sp. PMI808]|nr:glycoside hydrolase superfamily [Phaeosphaeriaceae sp. PMI808]